MAAFSISRAWDETKARIAADGRLFTIVAAALIGLPFAIFQFVGPSMLTEDSIGTLFVLLLLLMIFLIAGQLALIRLASAAPVSVGEALAHGFRRVLVYIVAAILIGIATAVLAIPVVLLAAALGLVAEGDPQPGMTSSQLWVSLILLPIWLFFWTRMIMALPVASEEHAGPIQIIRRSWNLTAAHFWRLLGFFLLFLIGSFVASMAVTSAIALLATLLVGPLDPMGGSALLIALAAGVVNAIFLTIFAVMLARMYLQLSGVESLDVTVPKTGT